MKKAPPVRISLRKLFVAMLAVGPVAILPAPVMAALPAYNTVTNTGSFVTTNGAVTSFSTTGVNGNGSATITSNDRSVLVWGAGNFNVGVGELFNFQTPIGGSVLNKVGYTTSGPDSAIISGNVSSGGRVFILANGSITVNGGANINTQGLFLSTLAETGDFAFTTSGNLSFSGASQGPITVGSGATQVQVSSGSLNAWAGSVTINNVSVAGDMLVNTGSALNIASIGGATTVTGNLSVITANNSVTQSRLLTVGGTSSFNTGTGSTTLAFTGLDTLAVTGAGTGYTAVPTVTLSGGGGSGATATALINTSGNISGFTITNAGSGYTAAPTVTFGTVSGASGAAATATVAMNDFVGNVMTTATGGVTLIDRNDLAFGASTAGSLTATAVGNVTTAGAVAVGTGGVSLNSSGVGNVSFNNGSSTTGTLSASVAGVGNTISINATGNLTTGTLTTAGLALNSATVGSGGTGYTAAPTVTVTGGGGSGATASATVNTSTGQVTVVGVTTGTGYTSTPTITFAGGGTLPNVAATANSTITGTTLGYTLNQVVPFTPAVTGSGYDMNNLPAVTVSGAGGATVTPTWVNGLLTAVTITNLGTGYTAAPTLVFTGGNPAVVPAPGPVALALAPTTLGALGVPAGGTGYTTAPTLAITGGGGSGATATATVAGGAVTSYSITNPGTGYTSSPTVTLTGGGTNPNSAATASVQASGNGGNVTVTSSGALTLSGNVQGGNVFVTAPSINSSGGTINTNGTLAYNATAGNLITSAANARKFVGVATGNITQNTTTGGAFTVIANSTDTHVFNATSTGNITLGNANNVGGIVQFLQGSNVTLNTSRAVTVGLTNATGSLTINTTANNGSGNVTLGTGGGTAQQSILVGGNLNITTNNSTIQDDNDTSPFVLGSTNLNTNSSGTGGANIVVNAAATNLTGNITGRFGQLNANAGTGSLTFSENTLTNVGNIIVGASSTIRSVNGDIVINGAVATNSSAAIVFNASTGNITQNPTGTLALSGTSAWNASNTAGFGTNLSSTTNVFTGNVGIINGNNDIFVAASNFAFTPGNVTSGNLSVTTVNPGNNVTINGGNMTNVTINSAGSAAINGGTIRNLTITANNTTSTAVTTGGNFTLNGTLTITTPGNATIGTFNGTSSVANITGNVVLANVTGDVAVHSSRNLTISGMTRGNLTATSGSSAVNSFANPWPMVLGNLNAGSLTAVASNGAAMIGGGSDATNGVSGAITQLAGSSLHIENALTVAPFGANIVLTNAGNSAGRVNLATGGNLIGTGNQGGNISYSEDSTIKVGNVTGNGTVSLSSAFGSIIEDPAVFTNLVSNQALTLSTPNGSVLLGNTTRTAGTTTGNFSTVNLTAGGAANILTSANVTLGAVSANSFAVTANRITQSAPLNIFGVSSFNATGSLGVVLDNAANNFGPVAVILGNNTAPATIVEGNTLNLRAVTMPGGGNGTLSFTSLNGDIIDTGLGGVRLGGNATATGSGVVTLNATNGNISIDDPTSGFDTTAGTVFNGKNVTFSILGSGTSSLVIGAATVTSTATGNFSATSALGSITNAGAFNVTGSAFFQTTTGGISINQPGVNFGSLKFLGNTVSIIEASDMVIQTGSQALGVADLRSGGSISIDNSSGGSVTFGSFAGFLASGNITLRSTQALNTITVTASGNKDLSALSLSTDLNNKTPVDLGAGAGPSTNPAFAPKP